MNSCSYLGWQWQQRASMLIHPMENTATHTYIRTSHDALPYDGECMSASVLQSNFAIASISPRHLNDPLVNSPPSWCCALSRSNIHTHIYTWHLKTLKLKLNNHMHMHRCSSTVHEAIQMHEGPMHQIVHEDIHDKASTHAHMTSLCMCALSRHQPTSRCSCTAATYKLLIARKTRNCCRILQRAPCVWALGSTVACRRRSSDATLCEIFVQVVNVVDWARFWCYSTIFCGCV